MVDFFVELVYYTGYDNPLANLMLPKKSLISDGHEEEDEVKEDERKK